MSKKRKGNVILGLLSVLIVCFVVGVVIKFTNGFNEDFKTFYLKYGDKDIVTYDNKMDFYFTEEYRFDVKYFVEPKDNSFFIDVKPNVDSNFSFTVDGAAKKWINVNLNNLSCFKIDKQENYFVLSFGSPFTVLDLLKEATGYDNVVIEETLPSTYLYTLEVSNFNGSIKYTIYFSFKQSLAELDFKTSDFLNVAKFDDIADNYYSFNSPHLITFTEDISVVGGGFKSISCNRALSNAFAKFDNSNQPNYSNSLIFQARSSLSTASLIRFSFYDYFLVNNSYTIELTYAIRNGEIDSVNFNNTTNWLGIPNAMNKDIFLRVGDFEDKFISYEDFIVYDGISLHSCNVTTKKITFEATENINSIGLYLYADLYDTIEIFNLKVVQN